MKEFRPIDNFVVWTVIEIGAMATGAWTINTLFDIAGSESLGRSITPATVLLSVAVAIITQLWVKINDLSGLASLSNQERQRLWSQVKFKVRALVWLIIFFAAFIFYVLACSSLAGTTNIYTRYLFDGVGAGFGACLPLLGAVLVDLNEVAHFRWTVETSDIASRKTAQIVGELKKPDAGFEGDQNLQNYKRVSGE